MQGGHSGNKTKKGSGRETQNESPSIKEDSMSFDDGLENPFEGVDTTTLARMVTLKVGGPEGELDPKVREEIKKKQDRK